MLLLGGAWTMMYVVSLTNRDHSKVAVANGQFFLIRREAYEKVGGHEAVRNQITEDVELMRLLKSNEFVVRFLVGWHLAATRMHSNLRQMFHGWGRIFSGTSRRSPWRILEAILFFLVTPIVYPAGRRRHPGMARQIRPACGSSTESRADDRLSGNNLPPQRQSATIRFALPHRLADDDRDFLFCLADVLHRKN